MKRKFKLPKFKRESAERKFWSGVNLATYFRSADFEPVSFPNLKPSSRSIAIRIPEYLIMRLKERANELNVPYQSLMKAYIARGVLQKR